jgi:hypothetical protein
MKVMVRLWPDSHMNLQCVRLRFPNAARYTLKIDGLGELEGIKYRDSTKIDEGTVMFSFEQLQELLELAIVQRENMREPGQEFLPETYDYEKDKQK